MRFLTLVGVASITFFITYCRSNEEPKHPNILLIMVDDMGYGDVSGSGNEYIKTPTLDAIARQGINFKNFYVSPVCAPTRASLLTGRYHQEVGVRSVLNGFETMEPGATTLAEILKKEGYRTGIYGKWHLGEYYPSVPNAQGFDDYFGFRTGHTNNYFDPVLEHNGRMEETKGYIADVLTDRAIGFMSDVSDQPFFCYLPFNTPHSPLQIAEDKFDRFLNMGLKEDVARVYGMVENIDENMGRILEYLEQSGQMENTILIFLSDNGPISGWGISQDKMRYNAGLRDQKFTTYEGGIRTQCYWVWKGHWKPFFDTLSVAAHIDVVPTLAGILGIQLHDSLSIDGIDLRQVIEDHTSLTNDRIYFEDYYFPAVREPALFSGGIARKGFWKMHGGDELYDLRSDPGEKNNVVADHPEVMEELRVAYEEYYRKSYAHSHFFPKPIKVGYHEENPVKLKAHHGKAFGNVKYTGEGGRTHQYGVDGQWTSGWRTSGDRMQWTLDFIAPSMYEIGITMNGMIGDQTCSFNVWVGDNVTHVSLPEVNGLEKWEYLPLYKTFANDSMKVGLVLEKKATSDTLNINELVITKLD